MKCLMLKLLVSKNSSADFPDRTFAPTWKFLLPSLYGGGGDDDDDDDSCPWASLESP